MAVDAVAVEIPGLAEFALIGRGGFATVYRARQVQFERTVAVKVMDADLLDEHAKRSFLRECRAAGRLSAHPNIVTMYDAGIAPDGRPFIVMEYCPTGSLAARVRDHGPMPAEEAANVGIKIADALAAAHAAGIIHRDVKPANILVSQYGEPALGDFGIASSTDASRSLQSEALTVDYAPPEVLQGLDPDPRSDLYSLGVTLYTLLTGVPPYRTSPTMPVAQQLLSILNDPVPRVAREDVPAALVDVIARLMAKNPADRVADGHAAVTELRAAMGTGGVPPPGDAEDNVTVRRADLAPPTIVRTALAPAPPPTVTPEPQREVPGPRRPAKIAMVIAGVGVAIAVAVIAVVAGGGGSTPTANVTSPRASTTPASAAPAESAVSVTRPASLSALMTALGEALPDISFSPSACQDRSGDVPGAKPPTGCAGITGVTKSPVGGTKEDPDLGGVTVALFDSAGSAAVQNAIETTYVRNLARPLYDAEIPDIPLSRLIVTMEGEIASAQYAWGWTQVQVVAASMREGVPLSDDEKAWVTDTADEIYQVLTDFS